MSNKTYDILNKVQRWLPFLAIFYLGIAEIWRLPFGTEVSKTIDAVAGLLAATLEISCVVYTRKMKVVQNNETEE